MRRGTVPATTSCRDAVVRHQANLHDAQLNDAYGPEETP